MSYIEVKWTEEQIIFALKSTIAKMKDGAVFKTEEDKYSDNTWTVNSGKIYISTSPDGVFMILNNESSGSFKVSPLMWKHRKIKKEIKNFIKFLSSEQSIKEAYYLSQKQEMLSDAAMRSLFAAFPEALDKEFEKSVLTDSDKDNG